MKQLPQEQPPRAEPDEATALGIAPEAPRDTRLDADAAPASAVGEPQPGRDEGLALPEGAWIAMRKSGGLLFSSREVVVYRDGRVTSTAIGGGRPARAGSPRRLTEGQLAALRRTVGQIDFDRLPAHSGRQGPDAYAYEIVARTGRASRALEVFDGSIPQPLAPLIQQLNQLLAVED